MKNKSNKPAAVIVGMESNGLGVARALAIHQIPCIALATPSWHPACQTKTCKVHYTSPWTKESVVSGLKSIGQNLGYKAPFS